MRKFLFWSGCLLLILAAGLYVVILLRQDRRFAAPYPNLHATTDSAVIARGKSLVFDMAHCADCHAPVRSEREVNRGGEVPLSGGRRFDLPLGTIYSKNLTPDETGIGKMTDPEIARALRYGVGADGRALFDFMPFHHTSDEDLTAIISWLRQQQPVKNTVPENKFNLLGKAVSAFLLKPAGPSEPIPTAIRRDTTALYGRYIANSIANCRGCHTNRNLMTGAFIGKDFSGGFRMETSTDSGVYVITSPNLTGGNGGRIRGWTEQQFIARFRMGKLIPQSHMPWGSFKRMSDVELKAIYKYLQVLRPVDKEVPPGVTVEKK